MGPLTIKLLSNAEHFYSIINPSWAISQYWLSQYLLNLFIKLLFNVEHFYNIFNPKWSISQYLLKPFDKIVMHLDMYPLNILTI